MSPSDPVTLVTTYSLSLQTFILDRRSVFLECYQRIWGRTGVTSHSLIPSLFQLRAAWNLSDFPRARIHICPATSLPWLRLNLILEYWRKDEGGWTGVPIGIVGGTAGDPQRPSYLRLLHFARSDSHSLRVRRREADFCEGMRIGKGERLVQRRPFHATQLPGSQSSGCQRKAASLS